jgi:raffinose/stachyose/melibiose transport system permease protein
MRSLPISVEEAATVDGANRMQLLFGIVFPMLKPVTATVIILTGVAVWNEFALSGYILTSPQMQTIAPAIASFFSVQSSNLPAAAAASLMAMLPVLVAYLFLQKYFIKGMVAGAEK